MEPQLFQPTPAAVRRFACLRCRKQKKKCVVPDSNSAACDRCLRLKLDCRFKDESPPSSSSFSSSSSKDKPKLTPAREDSIAAISNGNSSATPPASLNISHSSLDLYLFAAESSLLDLETCENAVEDPDLMPTVADWALVYDDMTKKGTAPPISFSLDGDYFLRTFFSQPAALRLTRCAMAAYTAVPPLPKHVAFTYYKRARKAVLQAIDKPSLQTVQAFYFINLFAQWNGQPSIGRPFFKSALDMLLLLQLDIDPDDSPWLYPLKLTDRQKEERRRVFWCCYWFLTLEQATTSDAVQIQLSTNRIRPPRPIEGVFKGFILQTCESQSLIAEIRRHHSKAPKSLVDILGSESIITLNSRLIQVHQQFPAEYLLIAENAENLSTLDYSRFLGQLSSILKTDVAYICTLNLNILASVCMLHRPKLYLSAVKHLDPEKLNDEARVLISSALSHSIDSAHRALCLLGFYLDVMEGSARERLPVDQRLYFSSQIVLTQLNVYPIFEVMIVFWFFVCRTRPCWRRYSAVGISNVPLLLERLVGLVSFVKRVFAAEKNTPGTMEPILKCMEAMVAEMSNLVAGQGATEFSSNNDVADLELGMKVMALGEQEEDSAVPIITQEPCAFLGLLGMEVAGGIRWKGRSEEAWRLFWKLNS